MTVEDPLAVVAGNHFEGRFTEQPSETSLNYINLPRARRILPVDALSWVAAFNAGYEPRLDCTAVRQKLFPLDELLQFHPAILSPIPRAKRGNVLLPLIDRKLVIGQLLVRCTSSWYCYLHYPTILMCTS